LEGEKLTQSVKFKIFYFRSHLEIKVKKYFIEN